MFWQARDEIFPGAGLYNHGHVALHRHHVCNCTYIYTRTSMHAYHLHESILLSCRLAFCCCASGLASFVNFAAYCTLLCQVSAETTALRLWQMLFFVSFRRATCRVHNFRCRVGGWALRPLPLEHALISSMKIFLPHSASHTSRALQRGKNYGIAAVRVLGRSPHCYIQLKYTLQNQPNAKVQPDTSDALQMGLPAH